jgi:hypothetical protein
MLKGVDILVDVSGRMKEQKTIEKERIEKALAEEKRKRIQIEKTPSFDDSGFQFKYSSKHDQKYSLQNRFKNS